MYTTKQIDRFWKNVAVGETADCWLWKRSQHSRGYGQVGLRVDGKDNIYKAHKVAWEIHNDQRLPPGTRATHSCDNPLCCNPHHIIVNQNREPFEGTPIGARGESHGMAKLTEKQVRLIKYRLNALTTREIADTMGVSFHTIWDIRQSVTWRHI